jgi:hypothetical protein
MFKPTVSTVLWMVFAWMLSVPVTAEEVKKSPSPLADISVSPTRIDWAPAVEAQRWVLTLSGPDEFFLRREVKAGKALFLSIFDSEGDRLPDGSYTWELKAVSKPESPRRQSGSFSIRDGSFVETPLDTGGAPKPPLVPTIAQDSIETGNLIVQQNACIGDECSTTDANFSALKLKSVQPNILFDDIALPEGPTSSHDWALFVNYNDVNQFSIVDFTNARVPFSVAAGAPDNSLYIAGDGDVGIGTSSPGGALHVSRSAGSLATLLRLSNNLGIQVLYDRTDAGANDWQTSNFNHTFQISIPGSATAQFSLASNGNLAISGILTQGSSRDLKTDFVSLDPRDVLAKVNALPVSMWRYKLDGTEERHVGPTAEDFHKAFGLGGDDKRIAPSDQAGVALVAVQGLTQEVETLRRKNADLEERIALLEVLLASLMPQD